MSDMQYDERGRPFFISPQGQKIYVSPVAMGGQAPEDTTSMFHERPQWDQREGEWETPFDWGNLLTLATTGMLGAGAGAAMMGGGAAGAGGAESMMGAIPASATYGPAAAGASGAGMGGAAAAGGGGMASWLKPALAIGSGLVGRAVTGGFKQPQAPEMPPEIMQLLQEAARRQMNQGPLSDAVTRQALAGLPNYAKK